MKKCVLLLVCFMMHCPLFAAEPNAFCTKWPSWFKPVCEHMDRIWNQGHNDLYLTGYAWHNRHRYSPEKIKSYNEMAWGGGLGRSYDADNNTWSGLYAFAFLDSHTDVEPIAGYGFLKRVAVFKETNVGLGYTIFLTSRSDIFHYIPFPGILPLVSLAYQHVTLYATYIPGAFGAGNVLFCFARYAFN